MMSSSSSSSIVARQQNYKRIFVPNDNNNIITLDTEFLCFWVALLVLHGIADSAHDCLSSRGGNEAKSNTKATYIRNLIYLINGFLNIDSSFL